MYILTQTIRTDSVLFFANFFSKSVTQSSSVFSSAPLFDIRKESESDEDSEKGHPNAPAGVNGKPECGCRWLSGGQCFKTDFAVVVLWAHYNLADVQCREQLK